MSTTRGRRVQKRTTSGGATKATRAAPRARRGDDGDDDPNSIATIGSRKADRGQLTFELGERGYEIVRKEGFGASASVYCCRDTQDNNGLVAVKVLAGRDAAACWKRECSALEKLSTCKSKHIPRLIDKFPLETRDERGESIFAIVTPFCDGGTMRHLLNDRGPLNPRLCRQLFTHISEAVAIAHTNGIAHCDIKLDNILLTSDGQRGIRAVLADWGLCESEKPEQCSVTRGTLVYAPPEIAVHMIERHRVMKLPADQRDAGHAQRLKTKRTYDALACDSWALGLCLWIMATGHHPFEANTSEQVYEAILRSREILAEDRKSEDRVSADIWDVTEMLMRVDPCERWQVNFGK
jgi:serine/threonine protein kinase